MDSDCEMDPRAEPRTDKGKNPVPAIPVPAARAPTPSSSASAKTPMLFKKATLKAPER